jgi:hypothetical protein
MSRNSEPWTQEAWRLHGEGLSGAEISRRLAVPQSTVSRYLFKLGKPPIRRAGRRVVERSPPAERPPRRPRRLIDGNQVMPAAEVFARGEIDRAELMRRIVPRGAG